MARTLVSQRLKESLGHTVQVDHGHLLALGHAAHGCGEIAVSGFQRQVVAVERPTRRGRTEDDGGTLAAHAVHKHLQVIHIVIPRAVARTVLFLVVMPELAHHEVALAQRGTNLLQPVAANKRACSQSALCMIAHGHAVAKPPRHHLSPRGVRVVGLVGHGRISAEIERVDLGGRLYHDTAHRRGAARYHQVERIIPGVVVFLTVLNFHRPLLLLSVLVGVGIVFAALVHHKLHRLRLAFPGLHVLGHQPSVLGQDSSLGGLFLRA